MILHELKKYTEKRAATSEDEAVPNGFDPKPVPIPFLIEIDRDGQSPRLVDTRQEVEVPTGKNKKYLKANGYVLPRAVGRTGSKGYEITHLLWDHLGYVLGYTATNDIKTPKQHQTWLTKLMSLPDTLKADQGVAAIIKFYENNGIAKLMSDPLWGELIKQKPTPNITFRLSEDFNPVARREAIQTYLAEQQVPISKSENSEMAGGVCLLTGEVTSIAKTFQGISFGGNSGVKIVSFQKNSGYDSYGKEQGMNAPIGQQSAFKIVDALNRLLKSEQKVVVGDVTLLFWAETPDHYEGHVVNVFHDDPDKRTDAIKALYAAPHTGALEDIPSKKRFFVLGITPNKSRIICKLWICTTISDLAIKIRQHFDDIKIVHSPNQQEHLSLSRLLRSTARGKDADKDKNILSNITTQTMRAILEGMPYPQTLLYSVIQRLRCSPRSEEEAQAFKRDLYPRMAIIKACLNRKFRNHPTHQEIQEMLDTTNHNIGYLLGRLFATLEKIQTEASPGLNATIRDRFYGAASGTPAVVFPNLMRLKNHHLSKLDNTGLRIWFEQLLGEIIGGIHGEFPKFLSLDDQGRFAIGYYHQMQSFYTKKNESPKETNDCERNVPLFSSHKELNHV